MKEYNFKEIEQKWQAVWEKEGRFNTPDKAAGRENAYILIEFPYPSGKGLHTGHCRSYSAFDILARKLRMQGKNVLFPIGVDAFGLEAERTAIKEKKLPQEIVERNTQVFKEQLKLLGLSIDWSRFINSSDPEYYKWTQWLFIQFFKKGVAYKGEANVNFCPNCGVLANEEVEDGKCCQCYSETAQKTKSQWIMRMTDYADRLIDDLDKTDYLPHIKTSQVNWIGRSSGVQVKFTIEGGGEFEIFTTCIETIYGITFMVLAPENNLVQWLRPRIKNWDEVEAYIKQAARKSEFERTELSAKDKSGCCLKGINAINPVNGSKVPVYIGDFVLAGYGTGAVMAVPAHDQRDYEFAAENKLPVLQVIEGNISKVAVEKCEYISKNSLLLNSAEFSGMTVSNAKLAITKKLVEAGLASEKINYKMRDWIFARQRYWGEPIPIINCPACGLVPVPDEQLPILLPPVQSYEPTKDGESPLAAISEFVNCKCPKCSGAAKRETDTMPGWAGSSWYFLRYCDPNNSKEFASFDSMKAWLPIAWYNGGNEHTTRHLLYARFWMKFFYDQGLVPTDEFCMRRVSHGMVLGSNGVKMSKSLGNVVDPRDVMNKYGADSLRLWEMFMGDYQESVNWNDDGIKACFKMLTKVWNLQSSFVPGDAVSDQLKFVLNQTIKKVTEDLDALKFNTAVSQIMILLNEIQAKGSVNRFEYQTLLTILNPFAPHITEEIWAECGFKPKISDADWPVWDEAALKRDQIDLAVQLAGKMRGLVKVPYDAPEDVARDAAILKLGISAEQIKKVIYVKNRIINIII